VRVAARETQTMEGMSVGRARGIELRLNWSVFIIAVLVAWSLADTVFPEYEAGRSSEAYWLVGAVTSAAFFASLVLHELGHSIVALREGVEVKSITLWLFGGVAQLGSEPETPGASFRIAIAGPAVSAACGIGGVIAGAMLDGLPRIALLWFGVMNLFLMLFNLLPAFPLDGGRIYQAWQWQRTGDARTATERAALLGLAIGAVLVGLGVLQMLVSGLVAGIWLMLIGWFIREAARAELRQATVGERLSEITVSQVMTPNPTTVSADLSVSEFIEAVFFGGRHAAYPVTDTSGEVTGLVTLRRLRSIPADHAGVQTLGELATPIADIVTLEPSAPVAEVLHRVGNIGDNRALVFDEGNLAGIVSPSDLARLIAYVELAVPIDRAIFDDPVLPG
jgi:Zn-dependent protease